MYDIANEEAAQDYAADINKRMKYVIYATNKLKDHYPEEELMLFEEFAFAFTGSSYFMCFEPNNEDFLEMAVEVFKYFDRSKMEKYINERQP